MTLRIAALTLAACGAIAFARSGSPQQPERAQQPPIRTQANYVRVDVYPLVDGRPAADLKAGDFEILEDGVPQVVENFEHIIVTGAGSQALRADPNSVGASRQAAADPRNRAFVVFLDVANVSIDGTWNVRGPLVKLVEKILGPQDVVGIMTPEMSPAQITFARKTEVVQAGLLQVMPWGTRHTLEEDTRETLYRGCYPPLTQEAEQGIMTSEIVTKMKARRRERLTLNALRDLSVYLRTLREGRTAVITVTEGWLLYRPDPQMTQLRKNCVCREYGGDPRTCRGCKLIGEEPIPGRDPIGIGPGGKLGRGRPADIPTSLISDCDTDRMGLAQMDNDVYFRTILEDANRANVSFYPVDPRGLAAWDAPLGPEEPPTMFQDQANLRGRHESMLNMASATDGLAVMTSNDLNVGLQRIADDLTSYYLLGYYSTNPKLDGKFRKISVRVKRPGVDVRARPGYRAPTNEEIAAARAAAPPEPVSPEVAARESAMASLARIRSDARFRIHAAPARVVPDGPVTSVWIAGELQPIPASDPWTRGGTADLEVMAGGPATTARVTLAAGERTFLTSVALSKPASGAAIDVRARLAGTDPGAARLADSIHVPLTPGSRHPLLFRRGSSTGNRYLPAATFLFSRTERLRIEFPVAAGAGPGSGRMLDRAGKPLPVPVAMTARTDAAGAHWITGDVTLAPLGAGDFVIEMSFTAGGTEHKAVTAVRVTR
jgi:VWFA-related protein